MKFKKLNQYEYEKMGKLSIVLVHAESCPNCLKCKDILDKKDYDYFLDGVQYYEMDMIEQEELAEEFKVLVVPHLIFFVNGKIKYNLWGLQEPFTINSWIQSAYKAES